MIRRIIFIRNNCCSCFHHAVIQVKKMFLPKRKVQEHATKVEFASLIENPDNYVGKNIIVEGKVVHVCTETGKEDVYCW